MTDDQGTDTEHSADDPRIDAISRAAQQFYAPPLDAAAFVRAARARRRRRRTIVSSVLAAAVIVAGVSVATAGSSPSQNTNVDAADQSGAPESQPFPDPPEGSKWVGMNGVVVAVPADWPVTETQCNGTASKVVLSVSGLNRACYPIGETARVTFAPNDSENPAPVGPPECQLTDPPTCYGVRDFADEGVTVRVSFGGEDASRDVERILDSAMVLPDGWTTVPVGGEDRWSKRKPILEDAGFTVDDSTILDEQDVPVRSEPESGSPVREGATITLVPNDSPPGGLPPNFYIETEDLTVKVEQLDIDMDPTRVQGLARWSDANRSVTYISRTSYDLCLADGTAAIAGGSLALTLRPKAPPAGQGCLEMATWVLATISGLTEAPTELTVTEDGETRTVPVEQEQDPETQDLNVSVDRPYGNPGLSKGSARWDPGTTNVVYAPATTYSNCAPTGEATLSAATIILTLVTLANADCDNNGQDVVVTISGFTEAPTELTVTEDGETRTVPVE